MLVILVTKKRTSKSVFVMTDMPNGKHQPQFKSSKDRRVITSAPEKNMLWVQEAPTQT